MEFRLRCSQVLKITFNALSSSASVQRVCSYDSGQSTEHAVNTWWRFLSLLFVFFFFLFSFFGSFLVESSSTEKTDLMTRIQSTDGLMIINSNEWLGGEKKLSILLTHSPVVVFLIYFELPKPVTMAEDMLACVSNRNNLNQMCVSTADSKLKNDITTIYWTFICARRPYDLWLLFKILGLTWVLSVMQ